MQTTPTMKQQQRVPLMRARSATGLVSVVMAAPHRLFFLAGALQLMAVLAFWFYDLSGIYLPCVTAPTLSLAGPAAHAFLMLYGLFTFFVFGFLTTVFPRWLTTEPIGRSRYTALAVVMTVGVLCFYAGLFTARPLVEAGIALFLAGWGAGIAMLFRLWRQSGHPDRHFALMPLGCISSGWVGTGLFGGWLITGQPALFAASVTVGLWLYLVPLIITVGQRLIPFFSANVLEGYAMVRPRPVLLACLALAAGHAGLTLAGQQDWTLAADLPLTALAGWYTWRWKLLRSLKIPLLGILHVSFAWLPLAMALYSAQDLLRLTGAGFDFGMAPLHALGIGFITSMVVAMASRVSLGHSGRPLVAGGMTLWAFILVQAAAVVRVLAVVPPFNHGMTGLLMIIAAAAVWLIAFAPWSLRFGLIYLTPRRDGRPG